MNKRPFIGAALLLALLLLPAATLRAQETSPYRVEEFAVQVGPGLQEGRVALSGSWVVWRDAPLGTVVKNLSTGQSFVVASPLTITEYDLDGDRLVTVEATNDGRTAIFLYQLPSLARREIAPLSSVPEQGRAEPRIAGNWIVWREGNLTYSEIFAHDLSAGRTFPLTSDPAFQDLPAVSGNIAVWSDARNTAAPFFYDIYGYDLAAGREFRITSAPAYLAQAEISGNTVVWQAYEPGVGNAPLMVYKLDTGQEYVLANLVLGGTGAFDIDGNLAVWSTQGAGDLDIFGHDLARGETFIISRAIGGQGAPAISGTTLVWVDSRRSGVGRYEFESDLYGARLEPGPAPAPPVIGAPDATDVKIEIVWPHNGSVSNSDRANVAAWLFAPGTLDLAPCQWSPNVQLWRAVDSQPAALVESAIKVPRYVEGQSRAVPDWQVNDLDVALARDPNHRVYFFVTVEGTPTRSNVWAHAADARTFFPQQDVPQGTAPPRGMVEGRIEIVWPHGGAPVSQATRVNVTAMLFVPGTSLSVPPDWNGTVRLLRGLNQNVQEEVAIGARRAVTQGGVTFPVWDFNDIDVAAARDPANKYFFRLSVDGLQTFPNIWVHGTDARTYFPQMDTPTRACQ